MRIAIDLLKSEHIGVRDLRNHLCQIFRNSQDKKVLLVVTERGVPVKVIMPYSKMIELLEVMDELNDCNTMRNIQEGVGAIQKGKKGVSFSRVYKKYSKHNNR